MRWMGVEGEYLWSAEHGNESAIGALMVHPIPLRGPCPGVLAFVYGDDNAVSLAWPLCKTRAKQNGSLRKFCGIL